MGTKVITGDAGRWVRLLAERRSRVTPKARAFRHQVRTERAVLFAEAFRQRAAEPLPLRWARAVAHVLERIAINILPGEVIAGEPVPLPLDSKLLAEAKAYLAAPREEHIRCLESYPLDPLYDSLGLAYGWHARVAHNILPYADILAAGIGGMRRRAAQALADASSLSPDEQGDRPTFYQAALVALDGLAAYVLRYATLARRRADAASPEEACDLYDMADVCLHVAGEPPVTLRQALQLVWFLNCACKMEDGEVGHSFGRFDQYLYPYYRADLDSGRATEDELLDLLTAFWIKINAESQDVMHMTLGGLTPEGKDATNALSFACLAAERRVCLTQPNLSARVAPRHACPVLARDRRHHPLRSRASCRLQRRHHGALASKIWAWRRQWPGTTPRWAASRPSSPAAACPGLTAM